MQNGPEINCQTAPWAVRPHPGFFFELQPFDPSCACILPCATQDKPLADGAFNG